MKTLIAILVVIFLANHTAAQNKAEVTGKIVTENSEGLLKIKTVAHNNSAIFRELNYTMVSVKKGKSGNSSNKQGGKFSIKPGETKTLSESAINLQKNDALKVFLLVKDEQTNLLVAKDSLEINADHFKSAVNFIPEKNIELSGLTIDDTKTRTGSLFYDSFFKKYNQLSKKFEGTITVSELPTIGRTTRIIISADDQMIYSFITKPDEEAMEAEADKTLANLEDFSTRNSLRNKEFKY